MPALQMKVLSILALCALLCVCSATATSSSFQRLRRQYSDCSCGYKLNSKDGAYFPYKHEVDFTQISSIEGLAGAKIEYNAGDWPIGPTSETDGVSVCKGSKDNYRFSAQEGLQLIVPAQAKSSNGVYSGAEVNFAVPVLHAVSTASIKLSKVPGSSQNFFTFTQDQEASKDEQDFEVPGSYWAKGNGHGQVQYGSYDPDDMSNQRKEFQYYAYTAEDDPSGKFLDYEIAWTMEGTSWTLNGKKLEGTAKYPSKNPSTFILNNWSNADKFTEGPPTEDVVMSVRKFTIYYATAEQQEPAEGCTNICTVD